MRVIVWVSAIAIGLASSEARADETPPPPKSENHILVGLALATAVLSTTLAVYNVANLSSNEPEVRDGQIGVAAALPAVVLGLMVSTTAESDRTRSVGAWITGVGIVSIFVAIMTIQADQVEQPTYVDLHLEIGGRF